MKHHEREFFICKIRSGTTRLREYRILPPTLEDKLDASEVYIKTYNEAITDEMMTEDEVEAWMIENGLWTEEDQQKLETAEKDIKTLKKEIFNHHRDEAMVKNIRRLLSGARKFKTKKESEKSEFLNNTAESAARQMEMLAMIKATTYQNNKRVVFEDEPVLPGELMGAYIEDLFTETQIRELARTSPWLNLWNVKDNLKSNLFSMPDRELTTNQHALIVWSQTYDNIQESIDCPTDDVINDDDMLDGWFILQSEKRQKDKSEKDFNEGTKSDKIKNSSEVFVMSKGKKDDERIKRMEFNTRRIGKTTKIQFNQEKRFSTTARFCRRKAEITNNVKPTI